MATAFRLEDYRLTKHAQERMAQRGMTLAMLRLVLAEPEMTYASHKFPGQIRVCRGEFVVTLDQTRKSIPTIFFNGRLDPNWKGGK